MRFLRKIALFMVLGLSLTFWIASIFAMQFQGPGVQSGMTGMMGMMGRMMGGTSTGQHPQPAGGPYVTLWPVLFIASASIAVIAVGGYVLAPEIPYRKGSPPVGIAFQPVGTVMRVVKEDERKVLKALMDAGGQCTQRDIAKQTQFTRLKTHRIIARLAERGIVLVEKYGNTNKITLPQWLRSAASSGRSEFS